MEINIPGPTQSFVIIRSSAAKLKCYIFAIQNNFTFVIFILKKADEIFILYLFEFFILFFPLLFLLIIISSHYYFFPVLFLPTVISFHCYFFPLLFPFIVISSHCYFPSLLFLPTVISFHCYFLSLLFPFLFDFPSKRRFSLIISIVIWWQDV